MAADVQTLEPRRLLSSIVVSSTSGGQNYAATVTAAQLDPTHIAVTLRDAVNAANNTKGADTISFDSSVFPPNPAIPTSIVLTGGTPLELSDTSGATTIAGPGAAQVAVSGDNLSTVLVVDFGVTAALDGLTITAGRGSINLGGGMTGAGGIDNNGRLTLQNMLISDNAGGSFGGGLYNNNVVVIQGSTFTGNSAQFGGGFFNGGTATVSGSTIAGNSAASNGGGFYSLATVTLEASTLANNSAGANGGGFYSNNTVSVIDSTITGNSAGTSGGGFINVNVVTLIDSTIAGNFASQGAGVYNLFATVSLSGTIVSQNSVSPTDLASQDWGGSTANAASSFNLIGDGTNSGLVNGTNHNLVGTSSNPLNPRLAPLGNNGGPTLTMALLPGNPAIDAGGSTPGIDPATGLPLTFDQRGAGFSRIVGGAVDIGAFEAPLLTPVVTSTTAPSVTYGQAGLVTVAVAPSNATGTLSLFVDGSSTVVAMHMLTAGDNGSFTFDVGVLNAGTHSLHAVFTATGNFLSSTADGSLVVDKANATVNVSGYSGTYDGSAHGTTGTVTGVGGDSGAAGSSLNLGASFKNVPGGTAHWVFSGGTNYNDQSGDVSIVIGVKTITGSVTANNKVFDGTMTATISGTSLAGVIAGDVVSLTVGAASFASMNVGTWTVMATGLGLSGAAFGNYVLASTTALTSASITGHVTGNPGPGHHHHHHSCHHHHHERFDHDHDHDHGRGHEHDHDHDRDRQHDRDSRRSDSR